MKSGFVSIVGRPNVGKSTLLNQIIGSKVAITSNVSGTTRNIIQGIYHGDDLEIVFIDTPGVHKPKDKLGKVLNKQAYASFYDVDLILFVVDVTSSFGRGDQFILDRLKDSGIPVVLVLNKIDKIPYEDILGIIDFYKDIYSFSDIVPVSSSRGKNIDELIRVVSSYLKDDIAYYGDGIITNVSKNFFVSELIREKVLYCMRDEIPHSVCCVVYSISNEKDCVKIIASLIVDRENLKKILVGKGGGMIKKIGSSARVELEELFSKKVYLDLQVKVIPNWRDQDRFLNQELGLKDFNE